MRKRRKKTNNHQPRAHFIIRYSSSKVFTFLKGREISGTTSLLLIHSRSDWWFPEISALTSCSICLQK